MIFVINALKYDTTKMELITTKCEYKYVRTMLNMTLRYSGKNVKIFKSLKNHWLLNMKQIMKIVQSHCLRKKLKNILCVMIWKHMKNILENWRKRK